MKVSASILSASVKPEELIKKFNNTNVDYIHFDVMDGKFVDNKSLTPSEIISLSDKTTKKLDVHLMVEKPVKYLETLALLNTEYITFHYEAVDDIQKMIDLIKSYGIKVGISINPNTEPSTLFPFLKSIDMILVMSVNPGKSGQKFIDAVLYKIEVLKKEIKTNNLSTIISVDGGVCLDNLNILKENGCDMVVSASFIQGNDMIKNIDFIKEL